MARSLLEGPVAFVDVETTGGHPAYHRVTEVAIIAVCNGEVEWQWSALVNPGRGIPPSIQQLTGITNDMVADAPEFAALADEVERRLAGRLFVAHNARFDYGFLRSELRRAGRRFAAPVACTVKLSRRMHPEMPRHNLDALIARHAIELPARHRALPDAEALWQLWQHWSEPESRDAFEAALLAVTARQSLPPQLPAELIDDLPEGPGVYRFFGETGNLIYVGKANNIRERVLGHFGGAMRDAKSRRLSEQTYRVEWTDTAGELGALLLEARLVRELKPVYNRRLRGGDTYSWRLGDDASPPQLLTLGSQAQLPSGDWFGLYRSEREARSGLTKLAREAKLCLKLLGLESGEGSCFGFQIGRCAGACNGKEPPIRHAMRLKIALLPSKLKSWPYAGPVAVHEGSGFGLSQVHVIDQWQYLGSVNLDDAAEIADLERFRPRHPPLHGFDVDAYRLLSRHLTPAARNVRLLGR